MSGVLYAFKDPDGNVEEGRLRLDGTVRRDALSEGQAEVVLKDVYGAEWSKKEARPDEKVMFSAKVDGFETGTPVTVQICKRDIRGADAIVEEIETKVQGSKVEGEWAYVYPEDLDHKVPVEEYADYEQYAAPQYYFEVNVGTCSSRSDLLKYQDYIEIELRDDADNPIPDEEYVLHLSHGAVRKGTLDANGCSKEGNVPPGKCLVRFPNVKGS